jgi:hypothetical protein
MPDLEEAEVEAEVTVRISVVSLMVDADFSLRFLF